MAGSKQHWYIATLIIRSKIDEATEEVFTCDEQIRLIRATSPEQAYDKALQLGQNEADIYPNVYGQNVSWEFVGLENLEALDDTLTDGTELRSRLFGHRDPSSLVRLKEQLSVFAAQGNPHSSEYKILTENVPAEDD